MILSRESHRARRVALFTPVPRFAHPLARLTTRAASPDHFLLKPRPLSSAYRSMKRMKRFHSAVVFIT